MNKDRDVWMWVAAAFLCTTIAASAFALNYRSQLVRSQKDYEALLGDVNDLIILVNLRIEYGDDRAVWHNGTRVPLGANLLMATQLVASVDYSTSDYGAFVTKIDEVGGDPDKYWLWYYYDFDSGEWEYGLVGCDAWVLHDGDVVSWVYSSF